MKKIYITKRVIEMVKLSELDIDFKNEFNFTVNDDDFDLISLNDNDNMDGEHFNIDVLISTLKDLKSKGATHVQIDTNIDHYGYDILGSNIIPSTLLEIQNFETKLEESLVKQQRINELNEELRRLTSKDIIIDNKYPF